MSGKTLAKHSFWLDGGYDFDSVMACPYHPDHKWLTVRLGDVLALGSHRDPDELMTFCQGCYAPRCGSTGDADRCTLWRHHQTAHVLESGRREDMGTTLTGAA